MIEIKESTKYENCIGVKDTSYLDNALPIEMDETLSKKDEKEWKKNWVGMPEFNQEENPAYKKIIVSFRTKEDFDDFIKRMDQDMTVKTKSIWHPKLDRTANHLMRWIEE